MHYVKVPAPVALMGKQQKVDDDGNPKLVDVVIRTTTMFDFVSETITNDAHFGKSAKLLMTAMRLCAKFEHAQPGEYVELEDADYEHAKTVLDAPTGGWITPVIKQYISFIRAFLEALDETKYKALPAVIAA